MKEQLKLLDTGISYNLINRYENAETIKNLLEKLNEETRLHSIRTALIMQKYLDNTSIISKENKDDYILGMLLHDIGKLYIPKDILEKEGKLDDEEMSIVRKHTENGYTLLKKLGFNNIVLDIVINHHERVNGKGYYNLINEEISDISKIAAIIDVFDAVTQPRCYKKKVLNTEDAISLLKKDKGLDIKYCKDFSKFILNNKDLI